MFLLFNPKVDRYPSIHIYNDKDSSSFWVDSTVIILFGLLMLLGRIVIAFEEILVFDFID